jgi:hypothetical protein
MATCVSAAVAALVVCIWCLLQAFKPSQLEGGHPNSCQQKVTKLAGGRPHSWPARQSFFEGVHACTDESKGMYEVVCCSWCA